MLSINVDVVSVILVGKDIVEKKSIDVIVATNFPTLFLLNYRRSILKSPNRKPIFFCINFIK